jgi:hypothetical protein
VSAGHQAVTREDEHESECRILMAPSCVINNDAFCVEESKWEKTTKGFRCTMRGFFQGICDVLVGVREGAKSYHCFLYYL